MDYKAVAALAIFGFTLFLMIKRPKGLNQGFAAGIGAAPSLLLGTVTLGDKNRSLGGRVSLARRDLEGTFTGE